MGAIARVLAGMGHSVQGSDRVANEMTRSLAADGIVSWVGHRPDEVSGVAALAASTAVGPDDPEIRAARELGIPVLSRAEILASICAVRPCLAVAGTHGKTSTASLLAVTLEGAGRDPSYVIGGRVHQLGSGARWGTGPDFVVEADESDGTFCRLPRSLAVVTNLEPDHLEHHGSWEALVERFDEFVDGTTGVTIVCLDDPGSADLLRRHDRVISYGTSEGADHRMVDVAADAHGVSWWVRSAEAATGLRIELPGLHNARNATAAFVAATAVGVTPADAAGALRTYQGVARRFEPRGEAGGVRFIDDYAHLPGEVAAAVCAARTVTDRRLVVVFQPHRYSRTEWLGETFGPAFAGSDVVVVTDVYASGEAPRPGISGRMVMTSAVDAVPDARVLYLPTRHDVVGHLPSLLRPGDLCLTLGAGDLTSWVDEIRDAVAERAAT